jgi:hypothetical protein
VVAGRCRGSRLMLLSLLLISMTVLSGIIPDGSRLMAAPSGTDQIGAGSLGDLARIRDYRSRRISSRDTLCTNTDRWFIAPGTRADLVDIKGAGCIKHIWMTLWSVDAVYPRKLILRMYWDGEAEPSVESPIGDFFGIGHGLNKPFTSLPITSAPGDGKGFNCYFPMPFSDRARIELESQCLEEVGVYFMVDYEEYGSLEAGLGRFHAQWRRENPTDGLQSDQAANRNLTEDLWQTPNTLGEGNYVILDAEGRGHYVGCVVNIDAFQPQLNDWYGEGDDMIFIDGEPYPSLHGTGTEDYFNMAWSPAETYSSPYFGISVYSGQSAPGRFWRGMNTLYRFHVNDPIHFDKSIRVTIEHGHANILSNDYSSVAYWYQFEPHQPFPAVPGLRERLPRS